MVDGDPSKSTVLINNLDARNPLHMNPNDSTSITFKSFKISWYYKTVESGQDRCNAVVLTWIMNSVSFNVYMGLVYSVDVASVWKELEKFDAFTKLLTCTCDANKKLDLHNKLMKSMQFLMGLDDCYQSVRSSLLTREPLPEVKGAYTSASKDESHRGIHESSNVIESKLNATSFMRKLMNLINETPTTSIHANVAVNTITLGWIINSNANQHLIVSTIGMFDVIYISTLNITIGHPNETLATISHVGKLKLTNSIVLYNVLVVPGYCVSLLSINKIIKDRRTQALEQETRDLDVKIKQIKVLKAGYGVTTPQELRHNQD
ncbi:hypothetical protein Tco_0257366 [Tanacetum coccineum]